MTSRSSLDGKGRTLVLAGQGERRIDVNPLTPQPSVRPKIWRRTTPTPSRSGADVLEACVTTSTGGGQIAEAGDKALLSAAALGDREAFEVVVRRYGPALHRYARRLVANEADAADVVQVTFIAAWRQLATFQGRSSLKTWLFSICSNKITDNYRVKRAQPIDDQLMEAIIAPQGTGDPFTAASNAAFLLALEAALAELPYRQRASWVLREIESLTFPEIGTALNTSPDAARGHHFRATATLRARMERWK